MYDSFYLTEDPDLCRATKSCCTISQMISTATKKASSALSTKSMSVKLSTQLLCSCYHFFASLTAESSRTDGPLSASSLDAVRRPAPSQRGQLTLRSLRWRRLVSSRRASTPQPRSPRRRILRRGGVLLSPPHRHPGAQASLQLAIRWWGRVLPHPHSHPTSPRHRCSSRRGPSGHTTARR